MDIQEVKDDGEIVKVSNGAGISKGIDIAQILDLRGKNLTQREIAKVLGISQQCVAARLKGYAATYHKLDRFKTHRADLFTLKQAELLEAITPDKLDKANVSQVATALGIIYDKERIERGLSTINVDIHAEVRDASARIQALREMIGVGGEGEDGEEESKVTSPIRSEKTKVSP